MPIIIQNRREKPRLPTAQIKAMAVVICESLGLQRPELSIVLTDDPTIQQLNKTWRSKDKPTDVLSFSQLEGEGWHQIKIGGVIPAGTPLGDVIISMDTAQRQASAAGHGLDMEMRRLLVHGVLHLLGHDHVHGGWQARRMTQEETRVLAVLRKRLGKPIKDARLR